MAHEHCHETWYVKRCLLFPLLLIKRFFSSSAGPEYVQEFCLCLVNAVASPFILYDLMDACAHFLYWNPVPVMGLHHHHHPPSNHPPQMQHNKYKSSVIAPLISKCIQQWVLLFVNLNWINWPCLIRFIGCAHHKIQHIATTDYDDFCSTIIAARAAFNLSPGGHLQFNELLQSLKRNKYCKKDLWQTLNHSLQQSSNQSSTSGSSGGQPNNANVGPGSFG